MMTGIGEGFKVWSAAVTSGKSAGRGSNGKTSAYGVKKLRELILELAVRGKLVPQDPADEPASELLERIAVEKKRLIESGYIKKQTTAPPIEKSQKPFQLPIGWEFARFGEVTFNRDAERIPISSADRSERQGTYDYYGASGVIDHIDDYLFDKPLLLIGEDGANLLNRSTPIAFMARGKYWVNNHAHVIDGLSEEFLLYLCLHINAITLEPYVTGTAQPKMNQAKMNTIILAIPPLAEQHRIVAKVDELMALCDALEAEQSDSMAAHERLVECLLGTLTAAQDADDFNAAWRRIADHFDTLFTTEHSIDQLKQCILQLAVMGKLVPQDAGDEPALNELQNANSKGALDENRRLPLAQWDVSSILPINWIRVCLDVVATVIAGNAFKSEDFNKKEGVKAIKITNIGVNEFKETMEFLPFSFLDSFKKFSISSGDILIAMTRPYVNDGLKVARCPMSYDQSLLNQRVGAIKTNRDLINENFLYLYLCSAYVLDYVVEKSRTLNQPNLNIPDLRRLPIPLPPLAEQHRIVAKVDELMALCEALKARLGEARTTQAHLADAVVAGAQGSRTFPPPARR